MRLVIFLFMIASLGIPALFTPFPTMADEAEELESADTMPISSSLEQAEAHSMAVEGSNDNPSTESIEVTRTLGKGDWLRFRDLSLQLIRVDANQPDNLRDDGVQLFIRLPEESKMLRVKELQSFCWNRPDISVV